MASLKDGWQPKAKRTRYGYIVKRKARKWHQCTRCFRPIEVREEYYQITNRKRGGYYGSTKAICEGCYVGVELKA